MSPKGMWNAMAQWMGVEDEVMANVLPNIDKPRHRLATNIFNRTKCIPHGGRRVS